MFIQHVAFYTSEKIKIYISNILLYKVFFDKLSVRIPLTDNPRKLITWMDEHSSRANLLIVIHLEED